MLAKHLSGRTVCLIARRGYRSSSAKESTNRGSDDPHQLLTRDHSKRNLTRFQKISFSDCKQQTLITACFSL